MKDYLKKLIKREDLRPLETRKIMGLILSDQVLPSQIGAFLTLLSAKGEAVEEITEIAKILRNQMIEVGGLKNALDIVGTGGDGYDTINVSTLACFVCAYLGVPIAKHGTRALSSKCGSFDLLDAIGVPIRQTSQEIERDFKKNNIAFLFAPYFHPALKKLHPIRKELGVRTIFNFVGPLLNPGNVLYQVIGVSSPLVARKIGETLMNLGRKRALVIHSRDGLDEVSVSALTDVYDYAPGRPMKHFVIKPKKYFPIKAIRGGLPEENAKRFKAILSGKGTLAENEFVAINSALGLYAVGKVPNIETGRLRALEALKSGNVISILEKIIPNKLDAIISDKKQELELLKKLVPLQELKRKVERGPRKIRDFKRALENNSKIALIAEIKKASPSLGDINTDIDIKKQASIYEASGANAISVLTDVHFKGELGFLKEIKKVTTIPILRKDFIFDPYQIYESYLAGADALLLIATMLDEKTLRTLVDLTHKLGMECLVETHTIEDIKKTLKTKAKIIGINARNLKTFEVSLDTTVNLAQEIPKNYIIVAESGIETNTDVERLAKAGASVILVGTTLMKTINVKAKIHELSISKIPKIKICGMTNKKDTLAIANFKPDYLGFIFDPHSPRYIKPKLAKHIISSIRKLHGNEISVVGVFVNCDINKAKQIIKMCGLDIAQLHGEETPEYVFELKKVCEIYKAIVIKTKTDKQKIRKYVGVADKILLDAGKGSGKAVDISLIENESVDVLAGGLGVENIEKILSKISPSIVDANSKLELSPGKKDIKLVREFITKVRTKNL